jgi:hypothetical protein
MPKQMKYAHVEWEINDSGLLLNVYLIILLILPFDLYTLLMEAL